MSVCPETIKTQPGFSLLDGQWDFPLVQSIFGEQYYDGFIPEMVIVGITWGGAKPNYDSLRTGDLTPTPTKAIPYGGNAPKFLQFIKNELIPLIESKYRVRNDDRTLMGTSLGGIFTLYTLFHETNLFNRYLLTSPALPWDGGVTGRYEKEFAAKNTRLPVKLFMGIGEYEDKAPFNNFVEVLKSRNYIGLSLESRILEGVGHSGTKPLGYSWGLQSVFARPSLNISGTELKQYSGVYRVSPSKEIILSVEKNNLMMRDVDGSMKSLLAETNNDFYIRGEYIFIHFRKDDSGKIVGFRIERFGGAGFASAITQ